MKQSFFDHLERELKTIDELGLFKRERIINTHQKAEVGIAGGDQVINLCANNYLGLADSPELMKTAREAINQYGYGMASVRFICGTQTVHKQLEKRISEFLKMEDTILYSSCFDANTGLFETLLGPEDAIISDALNHASIIDGVRLCKAKRFRYTNNDMAELEAQLQAADTAGSRFKLIATDGVFSMDGSIANLQGVCDLADKYGALVMVDDSHSVGFMGQNGRGTHEHCDVMGRVDIITGTLGKALGGASGGYVCAKASITEMLRQRSRPYLFSNTLAPVIAATSIKVLDMLEQSSDTREKVHSNAAYFRHAMTELGFDLVPGEHPIVPVMLGDAKVAQEMSARLLNEGVYAVGFFYPVVPQGKARIRTQMSAALDKHHLDKAIAAFAKVGRELGVIA
ncbi:MAG: glycine C-acetyltransferase [Motiliproteus sp.]